MENKNDNPQTQIPKSEYVSFTNPSSTDLDEKPTKTIKKRVAITFIFVTILAVLGLGFLAIYSYPNLLQYPSLTEGTNNAPITPKEAPTVTKRNTSLIAFIRDGDVWIGSINGNDLKQITSHPEISYEVQHVMSNTPQKIDATNSYAKFPRISHDGKYLAYIALTQESIDGIAERAQRIASESEEVKKEGKSEIFSYPTIEYALHIYNIPKQKEESIEYYQSTAENVAGRFQSLKWATNRNDLFFIKDYNLQMVSDNYSNPDKPLKHSLIIKNFCGINCNEKPDSSELISVKPDGSQIAAAYLTGNTCGTFLEFKLLTINLKTKQVSKQPQDLSRCMTIIGPWINNGFLAVEMDKYGQNDSLVFYEYGIDSWNKRDELFEDSEYQYQGPIQASPDGKYISYPLGAHTYGSSGKVDMRIRNLENLEFVDVLDYIEQDETIKGDKILYAKWDSNSEHLYFTLTGDGPDASSSLARFEVSSNTPAIVVNNATDTDIN